MVGRGVRPDADQRGHGERPHELRSPKVLGGRAPRAGRGRSGLAHGNGFHKTISEEPSRALRGARLPVCTDQGRLSAGTAVPPQDPRPASRTRGRPSEPPATGSAMSRPRRIARCALLPSGIDMASFRPGERRFTHRDDSTEDDTPAHHGGRVMGVLSGAEQAQWEEDGWCLVHGLLPPETIAAAQAVLPTVVPTAEEFADNVDPARNEPFRVDSHRVMPRFPFEDGALNDIVVHDRIIDLAEQLLGLADTELRLYQAMLSAKYGEGALSDEQLLHVDFGNHTLVVPRHEPGYQQLEMFVYLSDVTAERGATRVASRG